MNTNNSVLGKSLAVLKFPPNNSKNIKKSEPLFTESKTLNQLQERFKELLKNGSPSITIPSQPCLTEAPYLAGNIDFFLTFYLTAPKNGHCAKIIGHLNNCYLCFNIFTDVARAYYRQYSEIIKRY